MKKVVFLLLPVVFATTLAACASDDGGNVTGSASASASGAASEDCRVEDGVDAARDTEVHVDLDEWSIKVDEATVAAGNIEFHTTNKGDEPHELVIIEGAKPDELTIGAKGLDEDALPKGAKILGEIEPFTGDGGVCAGTFELAAGDYTLLCNIVEPSGQKHAHAHEGMVTSFTVTA